MTRAPEAKDPLIDRLVGPYRLERRLGSGGMGTVYEAQHTLAGKRVALKILSPQIAQDAGMIDRFLLEARSASAIAHENVIDVFDLGQSDDGYVFMAMELLTGENLAGTVAKLGPMRWARARGIALQIGAALQAAHDKSIIHRDLKPENIFIISKGGRAEVVKLLDFGIAKVLTAEGPKLTMTGSIFGTPEYMAPEQAEGRAIDHRADVYAFGCVVHFMITGAPPFSGPSALAVLTKHLSETPQRPSQRRPDLEVPVAIDEIVLRSLEKDRMKRWQDIASMTAALMAIGSSGPERSGLRATMTPPPVRLVSGPRPAVTKKSTDDEHVIARRKPGPDGSWSVESLPGHASARVGRPFGIPARVGLAAGVLGICIAVWAFTHRAKPAVSPVTVASGSARGPEPAVLAPTTPLAQPPALAAVGTIEKEPPKGYLDDLLNDALKSHHPDVARPVPGSAAPLVGAATVEPIVSRATQECSITIGSRPWAEVWVDGKNTNKHTPFANFAVACGRHKISFKRPDLAIDEEDAITVVPGKNFKRSYSLRDPFGE